MEPQATAVIVGPQVIPETAVILELVVILVIMETMVIVAIAAILELVAIPELMEHPVLVATLAPYSTASLAVMCFLVTVNRVLFVCAGMCT